MHKMTMKKHAPCVLRFYCGIGSVCLFFLLLADRFNLDELNILNRGSLAAS